MRKLQFGLVILLCGMLITSRAQSDSDKIENTEKEQLIDSITAILESDYVFPEVALKMNNLLKEKLKKKEYNKISDPRLMAAQLTEDLRSISKDLHLRVGFDPQGISQRRNASISEEDSIDFAQRRLRANRGNNYGFQEVRIMQGNVGYLNLTGFFQVDEEAGATAHAAMNFLANADALIIDLRQNGGGSPAMIQLITSYLYGPGRVHLNNFYSRPNDEHTQTWTLPFVPGKRRPDMDVYVLTSSRTFSAAEEFSYNLRNLERATLIGEVTGGGAHPGGTQIATERFTIWVPTGRAINPITNTNWEGVGVEPHVKVPAAEALEVAKIKALEKLLEKGNEEDNLRIQWAIEGIKAKKENISLPKDVIAPYVGNYGPRSLSLKDGKLYYQRDGGTTYQLIPMTEDKFMIAEIPYFRIQVLKEGGKVTALQGLYDNGRTDMNLKD